MTVVLAHSPAPSADAAFRSALEQARMRGTDLVVLNVSSTDALADPTQAPDEALPDTGVGLERERFLSSAFIHGDAYGTRASTVVLIADDHARIVERRFGPGARFDGRQVSWLAGRCLAPPSRFRRRGGYQWHPVRGSPLTVAGAAAESARITAPHRIPFSVPRTGGEAPSSLSLKG